MKIWNERKFSTHLYLMFISVINSKMSKLIYFNAVVFQMGRETTKYISDNFFIHQFREFLFSNNSCNTAQNWLTSITILNYGKNEYEFHTFADDITLSWTKAQTVWVLSCVVHFTDFGCSVVSHQQMSLSHWMARVFDAVLSCVVLSWCTNTDYNLCKNKNDKYDFLLPLGTIKNKKTHPQCLYSPMILQNTESH